MTAIIHLLHVSESNLKTNGRMNFLFEQQRKCIVCYFNYLQHSEPDAMRWMV